MAYPDPRRNLKIRSHRTMWEIVKIVCVNVELALILGLPLTIRPPEKWKLEVLNKGPTVLRGPGGLGDHFDKDDLDSVPYF